MALLGLSFGLDIAGRAHPDPTDAVSLDDVISRHRVRPASGSDEGPEHDAVAPFPKHNRTCAPSRVCGNVVETVPDLRGGTYGAAAMLFGEARSGEQSAAAERGTGGGNRRVRELLAAALGP